jgi:hypothetical protein
METFQAVHSAMTTFARLIIKPAANRIAGHCAGLTLKATQKVIMAAATLPTKNKGNAGLGSMGKSPKPRQPLFLGQ